MGSKLYVRKLPLLKPELYVVYTGERYLQQDDILLSRDIFGEPSEFLELKVKVIYNRDEKNIISEYINFTKIYDEQIKKYGPTKKAILETIRICLEAGILAEYLEERKREVVDIMMTLFSKKYVTERWGDEREAIGMSKGVLQNQKNNAMNMLRKGYTDEQIYEITEITPTLLQECKAALQAGI